MVSRLKLPSGKFGLNFVSLDFTTFKAFLN